MLSIDCACSKHEYIEFMLATSIRRVIRPLGEQPKQEGRDDRYRR